MLFLLAIGAAFRAMGKTDAPKTGDRNVLLTYLALVLTLTALTLWGGTPLDKMMSAPASK